MQDLNEITGIIIGASFRIGSKLGTGLREDVYESVLARDLARKKLWVERQRPISFDFEGMWFQDAFRVDLFVEHVVVVEIKSAPAITGAHKKQLLTYLRVMDCRLGLLVNFGATAGKVGLSRIVNGL